MSLYSSCSYFLCINKLTLLLRLPSCPLSWCFVSCLFRHNSSLRKIKFTEEQATKESGIFCNHNARWVGWLTPQPGRPYPGKEIRFPLHTRLGGSQGRSGRVLRISSLPGFDPRTVHPIVSQYID